MQGSQSLFIVRYPGKTVSRARCKTLIVPTWITRTRICPHEPGDQFHPRAHQAELSPRVTEWTSASAPPCPQGTDPSRPSSWLLWKWWGGCDFWNLSWRSAVSQSAYWIEKQDVKNSRIFDDVWWGQEVIFMISRRMTLNIIAVGNFISCSKSSIIIYFLFVFDVLQKPQWLT